MDAHDWDGRYDTAELIWKAEPNRFLPPEVRDLHPGTAVDLACGEGRNAIWLAEQGWTATGVDFSAVGLAKADQLAASRSVSCTWTCADLATWQAPEGGYDLAIAFYLQVPAPLRTTVFRSAAAALAPGGTLLIVGHATRNLTDGVGGPQDPAVLYEPADVAADLADAVAEGLVLVRAEHVLRPVGDQQAVDTLVRAHRR